MKALCEWEPDKKDEGLKKIKQEIDGQMPDRVMLKYTEVAAPIINSEARARIRIKQALIRDLKYASGNYVYLKSFGLSQALRETYESMKACELGKIANVPVA
jgi:hypothetical protein